MTYIIAEIGFNHEGDMPAAVDMIRQAAEAGADAVKFQSFRASDIALPDSPHFEAIRAGELSPENHKQLAAAARDNGITFLSTPFSPWAVEILEEVGVPAYKVASMDCTNTHLLGRIAQTQKPVYLSTGMATLPEIAASLKFLKARNSGPVTLLHCLSLYPAAAEDLNLNIIPFLKQMFGVPVGYSDHYPGAKACLAAVMVGADVIETHFTFDVNREGGDHSHSVGGSILAELIADIKLFKTMKGSADIILQRPDRKFKDAYRRGVFYGTALKKGQRIKSEDLLLARPVSQLTPNDLEAILERELAVDVNPYEPVDKEHLQ